MALGRQVHGAIGFHVVADSGRPEQDDGRDIGGVDALIVFGFFLDVVQGVHFGFKLCTAHVPVARLANINFRRGRAANRKQRGGDRAQRKLQLHVFPQRFEVQTSSLLPGRVNPEV